MKTLILALDGLEYDLVKRWHLPHLKQQEYGKTDLSDFKELATPVIWASFITGLPPEKHGVSPNPRPISTRVIYALNKILLRLELDKLKRMYWKLAELLSLKRVLSHTERDFATKGIKTIFDMVEESVPLFVPTYNPFLKRTELSAPLVMEDVSLAPEYERVCWRAFREKRKELFQTLRMKKWKLVMAYFDVTDRLGHIYCGNRMKMIKTYSMVNTLAKDVYEAVKDDLFFLIVSDHGMKPVGRFGWHTAHGFYSSNIPLRRDQLKITDFKDIILEHARTEATSFG